MPSSDSASAEESLTLTGVWIHDPDDAEDSVRNYLYGRSSRTSSIAPVQVARHYAGRTYPVVDFGEYEDEELQLVIVVPTGADWAAQVGELEDFARAQRVLCLRDNRGRRLFGTIQGYQESDADEGTRVSFTFRRVHYSEAVA